MQVGYEGLRDDIEIGFLQARPLVIETPNRKERLADVIDFTAVLLRFKSEEFVTIFRSPNPSSEVAREKLMIFEPRPEGCLAAGRRRGDRPVKEIGYETDLVGK